MSAISIQSVAYAARSAYLDLAGHLVQGVGQTSHELGVNELGLSSLELRLLLDLEGGGLHAELVELVVTSGEILQVGGSTLDDRAGVGDTGALHLQVGQTLQLVEGQSVGLASQQQSGGGTDQGGGLGSGGLDLDGAAAVDDLKKGCGMEEKGSVRRAQGDSDRNRGRSGYFPVGMQT